jgi:uncharacterized protein (DUF4415 family)
MKNEPTSTSSQTDWARIDAMRDEDIDLSDIPEATAEDFARGVLQVGGKPVARGKRRVNIYLDHWIVEMFKQRAGARGYQTLINAALAQHLLKRDITSLVRRVVREELQAAQAAPQL